LFILFLFIYLLVLSDLTFVQGFLLFDIILLAYLKSERGPNHTLSQQQV